MNQDYKPSAGEHPITPPDELVCEWCAWCNEIETAEQFWRRIARQAAQWGADMELEACAQWLRSKDILEPAIDALRSARRSKPPTLKEQALAVLDDCTNCLDGAHENTIRRALEQLPDAL